MVKQFTKGEAWCWACYAEVRAISIQLTNIAVGYRDNPVVSGVNLEIAAGEHVVIVGANGTGKSTLLRTVLAFTLPQQGSILVDGIDPFQSDNRFQIRRRVGFIQQRPDDQLVATSVLDEVAFGPENLGLPRAELIRRCEQAIAAVGLAGLEHREPHTLSGGQKQRLAIAAALAMEPAYLVCDEPTALLDPEGKQEVLSVLRQLVAQGVGVLHVTHDLSEAREADRILVLSGGDCVFSGTYDELVLRQDRFHEWAIELSTPIVERRRNTSLSSSKLALQEVSVEYQLGEQKVTALKDVSLEVASGELVMVVGATGSGKSTALRLLAGLLEPTTGAVITEDTSAQHSPAQDGSACCVGLAFQDAESALFADTVLDDVAFGPLNYGITTQLAYEHATAALRSVGLDPHQFGDRSPFTLSGGEARRVALAGILALRPRFLLADEPTAALDAPGRRVVRELLANAASDAGVVVVTHAPDEFIPICDRVWVFSEGSALECTPQDFCTHYRPDLVLDRRADV